VRALNLPWSKRLRENSAVVPVTQNRDFRLYDWEARHRAVLDYNAKNLVDLVWLGDSIAHRFGGPPTDGTPTTGQSVWQEFYGHRNAVDMGFGYDRTENVLWRIENGELDGISPKVIVVLIGTNNLAVNTVLDTFGGVQAVLFGVRKWQPDGRVLLLGVLPRGKKPCDSMRRKVEALNELLSTSMLEGVTYLDAGSGLVGPDGRISESMMPDYLHPTEQGYRVIAENVEPTLAKLLST